MKFQITNLRGEVVYECEIEADEDTSPGARLGLAILAAVGDRAPLSGANRSGANLSGANLSGADLHWANLRWANLSGANLSGADLSGADLRWADLSGADLAGANLSGVELRWANLSGAHLSGARLSGAHLSGARLEGADLCCMGDMRVIRTMQIDKWEVGYTSTHLQIGCQRHGIDKWRKWDTEAGHKWIAQMDHGALYWAQKNLDLILTIIDRCPAENQGETTP